MTKDLTISKGSLTVTLQVFKFPEEYSNKLTVLPIPQTANNQASGPKDTKILDLLRLTHSMVIGAYISPNSSAGKTAKQVKDDLKSIVTGANINGGTCELVYDGDTYHGFIEKLVITENPQDDPVGAGFTDDSLMAYEVTLTFIEGIALGVS